MERIAPFFVVTNHAAVLAKRSIARRSSQLRSSSPCSSTKFSTLAQKVSPAPVVSITPPRLQAGTTCAEGVARTGGLDHAAALAGGHKDALLAVVGVAPLSSGGDVEEADIREAAAQDGGAPVKIALAGHEQQLVVGDLEHVAAGEAPLDGGFRVVLCLPEREAEVRVKGDQRPGFLCQLHGLLGGGAAGLVRQRERAEVEDAAAGQQLLVQLLGPQHNVGARLAVKAEVAVAVGEGVHHGERGGDLPIPHQAAGIDPCLLHGSGEHVAEAVGADLADEGAALAEFAQHGQNIGGRAAGIGLKEQVALLAQPVLREVDQKLAQGDNVKCFILHGLDLLSVSDIVRRFRPGLRREG